MRFLGTTLLTHMLLPRRGRSARRVFSTRHWALGVLAVVATLLALAPIAAAQTPGPASGTPTPDTGGAANGSSPAHQETLEARVLSATAPGSCDSASGDTQVDPITGKAELCQKLRLLITKGTTKGETINIDEGTIPVASKANVIYR